ncbi:MAG: ferredoxin [Lentisphaerae bacterium GWF2_38_69]|nr:MAG: ferredoxin [Lentisphaerae bacterium GWF2_38_69]
MPVNIEINNISVKVPKCDTILSAAKKAGIKIPTLCHLEGLLPSGACRICVVELEGSLNLVPACSTAVRDGMKVKTHTARTLDARRTIVELLLNNHPDDCNYCLKNNYCELQKLAYELNVRTRSASHSVRHMNLDCSSPSLLRDPNKCILCGRCVRICEEIQGVSAIDFIKRGSSSQISPAFEEGMNLSSCVYCGQCVKACPTGALIEKDHVQRVIEALNNPKAYLVVQHAPAVSVSLAEDFGFKPGVDVNGIMVAALRRIGFKKVFDTSFSADLTIMEEGSELIDRIKNNGVLPMITSCSPGWIKFIEQFYPELLPHVSSCKSPQQMLGAVIKSYFAEKQGLKPEQIFSVSIMPCTAKKFESDRTEMQRDSVPDIDAVLTTRELGQIIKIFGIDMKSLKPETADTPFGTRSSAGKIFGTTGGVMEAAIRSVHFLITGKEMENPVIPELRGLQPIKRAKVKIGELDVGVGVAHGLANARVLLDELKAGSSDMHFIEIMTCPGGCINGGGQPYSLDLEAVKARMKALYKIDASDSLNKSHMNEEVGRLYREFLGSPLGEKSHELLHTHYHKREVLK